MPPHSACATAKSPGPSHPIQVCHNSWLVMPVLPKAEIDNVDLCLLNGMSLRGLGGGGGGECLDLFFIVHA